MNIQLEKKFTFRLRGATLVMIDWANVYRWKDTLGWEVDPNRLFSYLSSYEKIWSKRFYCSEGALSRLSVGFKNIGYDIQSKEGKFVPVSLEKSHFRKIIKELFNVLDGIKTTNSAIANKLYELIEKIENRLADGEPDFDSDGNVQGIHHTYAPEDQTVYDFAYGLIEELDIELKKLNINIDDLQKHLSKPVMRPKCDFDVELARDAYNLSRNFKTLVLFSGDGDYAALVDDLISKGKIVIVVFASDHMGKEYKPLWEKLKKEGKSYTLFVCAVDKLKEDICIQKITPRIAPRGDAIPINFSTGRDIGNIAYSGNKSQEPVDKP